MIRSAASRPRKSFPISAPGLSGRWPSWRRKGLAEARPTARSWGEAWRAGESGAGAFVLVYLLAVFIIAAPLFMAETLVGRFGRHSAPNTFKILARERGKSENWRHVGWLCIITSLLVLSFFSVIAGNALAYVFKSASGAFAEATRAEIGQTFADYAGSPWAVLFWHTAFAGATAFIVSRGIKGGLERAGRQTCRSQAARRRFAAPRRDFPKTHFDFLSASG